MQNAGVGYSTCYRGRAKMEIIDSEARMGMDAALRSTRLGIKSVRVRRMETECRKRPADEEASEGRARDRKRNQKSSFDWPPIRQSGY